MATVTYTANHPANPSIGINGYKWETLTTTNDTGSPVQLARMTDRTIQVTGTFGAGGTVVIEGSLDGTNYYTLNDLQGTALSITAAKIEGVSEVVTYIRPRVTAGDGTTDLDVFLVEVGVD